MPPTTELQYHRASREPALRRNRYKAWKPALEIVLVLVLFVMLQAVFVVGFLLVGVGNGLDRDWFSDTIVSDQSDTSPLSMLFYYGALAFSGLGAFIAAWAAGRKPGALFSVAGRVRWRVMAISLCWIGLPAVGCFALDALVNRGVPAPLDRTFWLSSLIWATLIPLQCTAEELIFRGCLPQALGAWIRSPWVVFAISLPLFVAGHAYGLAGLASVAVFAALASLLVHRTGGLEAAIALHCTNNMAISYSGFSGIDSLPEDNNRILITAAAVLLQYAGAAVLLFVLRGYAPAQPSHPPGWFPGTGWFRGWPRVVLRFPPTAVAHRRRQLQSSGPGVR
ncbi:CPBP family intramembrane glutamic endopeptidase [Corynebacterium qintianiae]|uniref:CPBP family intramembrane glutamic endopeptidase n=1 Tax=Corynebacterium qintianiae TaxID=2709392 RepID=UPI0013EA1A50|nr:CPBP family intramembrane glutamic endopeptidase [Corynebacterium qintianiae]